MAPLPMEESPTKLEWEDEEWEDEEWEDEEWEDEEGEEQKKVLEEEAQE